MKTHLRQIEVPLYALLAAALALAGCIFLLAHSARIWTFTVDDAFITYRYSANLVRGIGPTFNYEGPLAEGYTSFLWMLTMALPHLLGYGPLTFAKSIGVASTVGTMACMGFFLWRAGPSESRACRAVAAGLMVLFFSLLPETAVHAISGMETALYTFLLSGLVTLAYLSARGTGRAAGWLPLAALLAGLTRPEANLPAAIVLGASLFWLEKPRRKGFLLRVLCLYLLPGAVYFLWRCQYYGLLFPLPFYVKTGGGGLPGLPEVGRFAVFVLASLGLYAGLGLLGERRAVQLILLAALPDLAFFLFAYPVMEYDYRFAYPLLPLILVLGGLGLALLLDRAAVWGRGRPGGMYAPAWLGLLALSMFAGQQLPRAGTLYGHKLDYALGMARAHYAIGHVLNGVAHTGESPVLAVNDAGAMPYFSGWKTVDAGGLNNPDIALGRVEPVTYIFGQDPEVLVLTSTSLVEFRNDSGYARDLYQAGLARGLAVAARIPFYQGDALWVLARPGGEAEERLMLTFDGGD